MQGDHLGIDPSTKGFYYSRIRQSKDGQFNVVDTGKVESQSGAEHDAALTVLSEIGVRSITIERVGSYLEGQERFYPLILTSEWVGILRAVAQQLRYSVLLVEAKKWRRGLGVHGGDQDKQVKMILEQVVSDRPKKGWNVHTRDATGIAIYGCSPIARR